MKKIYLAFFLSFFLLTFTPKVFAALDYTRTPAGSTPSSPVSISVNAADYSELTYSSCDPKAHWAIVVVDSDRSIFYYGSVHSSSQLSASDVFSIPEGNYNVQIAQDDDVSQLESGNQAGSYYCSRGTDVSNEDVNDVFTISAAATAGQFFTISPTAGTNVLATVSEAAQQRGMVEVISIVAGLPLAFYAILELINLLPGRVKKAK